MLNTSGFLTGLTGGYNWQINQFLFGLEADLQALSISNTNHTDAIPYPDDDSRRFVLTTYGSNNWLLTARPRAGMMTNAGLFYLTGGLALTRLETDFVFANNRGDLQSKQVKQYKYGYALGAGYETGLTKNISLKLEYLATYFNNTYAHSMNHQIASGQALTDYVNLREGLIRVGLNYHFGNDALLMPQLIPLFFQAEQWKVELGMRSFISTGDVGAPQPLLDNTGAFLISRLTYQGLDAASLEGFGRLDHESGIFIKGNLGAGSITSGQLIDEDFPAGGAYSRTASATTGNLSYGTADIGYSIFKTNVANTGLFIGYNYFAENINAIGCSQLAGASVCVPSSELANYLGLSEDDQFNSLRIGLTSQFAITKQLRLTSEAAYLPMVRFRGQDNHNARQLIIPEQSSSGDGSMLEAILSYQFADSWNIGLGARYWMYNMHGGLVKFDFLDGTPQSIQHARYDAYRYGAFLQLTYIDNPLDTFHLAETPMNWRGFYIGGNLGGAWGKNTWSDPFGSTLAPAFISPTPGISYPNIAGFGNDIYSRGPLGGVDMHYYWQRNQTVMGLGGSLEIADIRGENTLFSGLGGLNGQSYSHYLMMIYGRLGAACDHSLFYINFGPTLLNTQFRVNGNTGISTFGVEAKTLSSWGATLGAGVDYALTDKWTTNVEYDYIRVARASVYYPTVAVVNTQSYQLRQYFNVFKIGLSYKIL